MTIFNRDCITPDDSDEAGIRLFDIGRSIMVWSSMNYGRRLSVAEAATVFNTTADIVREAVGAVRWVYLTGDETDPQKQFIEADGE